MVVVVWHRRSNGRHVLSQDRSRNGFVFYGPRRRRAVRSGVFGELVVGRRIWHPAHHIRRDYREEAGYISCSKYFDGRVPKTEYKLTAAGRKALEGYLSHMETLIQQMRKS